MPPSPNHGGNEHSHAINVEERAADVAGPRVDEAFPRMVSGVLNELTNLWGKFQHEIWCASVPFEREGATTAGGMESVDTAQLMRERL